MNYRGSKNLENNQKKKLKIKTQCRTEEKNNIPIKIRVHACSQLGK